MIKTNKIISTVAIALAMMVNLTSSASASNITYSADTVVDLTDADFTISAGSAAGGVVVNANTIVVTMAAGDYFVITSSTRGITVTGSNSGISLGQTCGASLIDTVTINSSTGAGSYTLAPSAAQCTYTSSGGSVSTPTPTPTPTVTPTPTATPAATPTPTPTIIPGPATPAAPSGVTLYRVEGDHRVYVVKEGKKEWIKTAEDFNAAGYKWSDIIVTTPAVVAAYPDTTAGATIVKVIGTPTLRVRQSNTTKSNVLGYVKLNETFTVLEQSNNWYKITTASGITGWISGAYAALSGEGGVSTITISVSALRVRSSNGISGKVLGTVRSGEKYSVIEENSGWFKIKTSGGVTGWVLGTYVTKQ